MADLDPAPAGTLLANRSRMAHAKTVRPTGAAGASRKSRVLRGEFFSLGGLLAPYATTRLALAPWAFSAAVLATLASWDPVFRGGEFDAILIGLACYELLIGLTAERQPPRARTVPSAPPEIPAS